MIHVHDGVNKLQICSHLQIHKRKAGEMQAFKAHKRLDFSGVGIYVPPNK